MALLEFGTDLPEFQLVFSDWFDLTGFLFPQPFAQLQPRKHLFHQTSNKKHDILPCGCSNSRSSRRAVPSRAPGVPRGSGSYEDDRQGQLVHVWKYVCVFFTVLCAEICTYLYVYMYTHVCHTATSCRAAQEAPHLPRRN